MKLNKKQLYAISCLKSDIDELSNKPRRLFSALRLFAEAFIVQDDEDAKSHFREIIADIDEWEEDYYRHINHYDILEDCGKASRNTRKKLMRDIKVNRAIEDEVRRDFYKQGVDDATKEMALMMTKNLIEELY